MTKITSLKDVDFSDMTDAIGYWETSMLDVLRRSGFKDPERYVQKRREHAMNYSMSFRRFKDCINDSNLPQSAQVASPMYGDVINMSVFDRPNESVELVLSDFDLGNRMTKTFAVLTDKGNIVEVQMELGNLGQYCVATTEREHIPAEFKDMTTFWNEDETV